MPSKHLGILQPRDYYGEVTGTVTMMSHAPRDGEEGDGHSEDDGLKKGPGGVVLNPQPQNDPNDPLNWPMWRRDLALGIIGFHSFIIGGQSSMLAAAFTTFSEEFNKSQGTIAYLVGGFMLAMGVGSIFFAPTAVLYGKRLVYLVSQLVFIGGAIWGGCANSFGSLMGARILMGIGGSPTESLPSSSIAEIYFLHERAYRLGIYTLLMLGGKNIVPMVAGFVIGDVGWNWVFWILTIIVSANFALMFFFVPETWWDRTPTPDKRSVRETELAREARASSLRSRTSSLADLSRAHSSMSIPRLRPSETMRPSHDIDVERHAEKEDQSADTTATTVTTAPSNNGEVPSTGGESSTANDAIVEGAQPADSEKTAPATEGTNSAPAEAPVISPRKKLERHPTFALDEEVAAHRETSTGGVLEPRRTESREFDPAERAQHYLRPHLRRGVSAGSELNPKKTYKEMLKVYNGRYTDDKYWMVALRPFFLLLYPGVLFSTFIYSLSVVWLIVISETISHIMSAPPYNFSITSVGLLYIATFIGGCLGSAVAGRFSDLIVRAMSRRNNGTYEPEFRLMMIGPVLISICIGMMGFGWSTFEEDMWVVPAIFLGVLGFGCSLGSTTAITYAVDSYKMFAAEALVTLNMTKNTMGFLFSLFVPQFVSGQGSRNSFVVFGSIEIFVCLFGIPLYFYGKRVRHWTDRANLMKYLYVDDDDNDDQETLGNRSA